MQTHLKDTAGVWDSESGDFLTNNHRILAEILHDYNPHFSLVWIPPKNRDDTDSRPFAILDSSPGLAPYVMRYLSEREMDNPDAILAWIFDGDLSKNRSVDVLQRMDNRNNAKELMRLKKEEEEREDRIELGAFMFSGGRNRLNRVRHGGQVIDR